jgi:hypothetical protein
MQSPKRTLLRSEQYVACEATTIFGWGNRVPDEDRITALAFTYTVVDG